MNKREKWKGKQGNQRRGRGNNKKGKRSEGGRGK